MSAKQNQLTQKVSAKETNKVEYVFEEAKSENYNGSFCSDEVQQSLSSRSQKSNNSALTEDDQEEKDHFEPLNIQPSNPARHTIAIVSQEELEQLMYQKDQIREQDPYAPNKSQEYNSLNFKTKSKGENVKKSVKSDETLSQRQSAHLKLSQSLLIPVNVSGQLIDQNDSLQKSSGRKNSARKDVPTLEVIEEAFYSQVRNSTSPRKGSHNSISNNSIDLDLLPQKVQVNNYAKVKQRVKEEIKIVKPPPPVEVLVEEIISESNLSDSSYNSGDYRYEPGEENGFGISLLQQSQSKMHVPVSLQDDEDILDIVQQIELDFIPHAQELLSQQKQATQQVTHSLQQQQMQNNFYTARLVQQRVLKGPHIIQQLSSDFKKKAKDGIKVTCVSLSEISIVVGTTLGYVFVYERDTEQLHGHFKYPIQGGGGELAELQNAITCLDVHPKRSEYVVAGLSKGHIVLLDTTRLKENPQAYIKLIKDQFSQPLSTVRFCDYFKEKPYSEDKQAWMFACADTQGKVVVLKLYTYFKMLTLEKIVLIDPSKMQQKSIFQIISCYFQLQTEETTLAIGSSGQILVLSIDTKNKVTELIKYDRPQKYPSDNLKAIVDLPDVLPSLSFGQVTQTRTPQEVLAVGWGPLIQLLSLPQQQSKSKLWDWFYIIAPTTEYKSADEQFMVDPCLKSVHFISLNLLCVTMSTHDIRVLHCKHFKQGRFQSPFEEQQITDFNDPLTKMAVIGQSLTKQHQLIELERKAYLDSPIQRSEHGQYCDQTMSASNGQILLQCDDGNFYFLDHMTWQDYVQHLEPRIQEGTNWIDLFNKMLEIYRGNVKGLRHVSDDEIQRQQEMSKGIKTKILETLEIVILYWRGKVTADLSQGKNKETVIKDLERKLEVLIRLVIEVSTTIQDFDFLWQECYRIFKEVGYQNMFCKEAKGWVLSGVFADWNASEDTLNFNILQYHQTAFLEDLDKQNEDYREGIEKILLNLKFEKCSIANAAELISFCHQNSLVTGAVYLCLSTMGMDGPVNALKLLRDFYHRATEEVELDQIKALTSSQKSRVQVENSKQYVGLKLIWFLRLLLQGKKFPRGQYNQADTTKIVNLVLHFLTSAAQQNFLQTLFEIDPYLTFQLFQLFYDPQNVQFDYLTVRSAKSVSHEQLFVCLMNYSMLQPVDSEVRGCFQSFLANISPHFELLRQKYKQLFFYQVMSDLFLQPEVFLIYNEKLYLSSLYVPNNDKRYRDCQNNKERAQVLSEDLLLGLLALASPLQSEHCNKLVQALENTQFKALQFDLYDNQKDYVKCLQIQVKDYLALIDAPPDYYGERRRSTIQTKKEDLFTWILKIYCWYETAKDDGFQAFQTELHLQIPNLIQIDAHKTIGVCEAIFMNNHLLMLDCAIQNPQMQYNYIDKLLEIKYEEIKSTIRGFQLQKKFNLQQDAEQYVKVLQLHIRLTSKLYPDKIVPLMRKITKDQCCSLEECLQVCRQGGHIEAVALLSEELGNYTESIKFYLEHLVNNIKYKQMRRELFYWTKNGFSKKLANLQLVENTVNKVMQIVKQHPETVLKQTDEAWQCILDNLSHFMINPLFKKKKFCTQYFYNLLLSTCRLLLAHVPFTHLVTNYLKRHPSATYTDLKPIISEVFLNSKSIHLMSVSADRLIHIECARIMFNWQLNEQKGILLVRNQCCLCKKDVQVKQSLVFECKRVNENHVFHHECLKSTVLIECKEKNNMNLRCIECHPSNYDLSVDKKDTNANQDDTEEYYHHQNYVEQLLREEKVKQTQRLKRMKLFDEQLYFASQKSSDFKLLK